MPGVAQADGPEGLVVVPEGVHVDKPRRRHQQREDVAQGHRHQHHVGGRAHVPPAQHHHDQGVEDHSHDEQEGHGVSEERDGVPDGHFVGDVQQFGHQHRPVGRIRRRQVQVVGVTGGGGHVVCVRGVVQIGVVLLHPHRSGGA